jgi:16S rRNA (uracil1498-N3)-methyltransferase
MSRRRFYVPRDSIREGIAALPPGQAHHLLDVLRLGAGDVVEVFDGEGNGYVGEVELHDSGVFVCRLKSLPSSSLTDRLILAAALIKSAKFEWMLQKTTELGVSEIVPLKTSLSDIQLSDSRITLRLERWDRILKEAAKQCGRFSAPRLHKPLGFSEFLDRKELSACARLLFDQKACDPWQPDKRLVSDKTVLCIGPEGGWETGEMEQAERAGYKAFNLGPWKLRAETAAVAAVAIIQHQIHLLRK